MTGVTAVVIDDEPIVRMDFTEMLREQGVQVLGTGSDGFDAVDLCRKYRPDVVLLDIKMPIFDGLDAAQTILTEMPEICVMLITAFSDDDYIHRARSMGVAGYLVKPIDERKLKPALEIALAQHRRYTQALRDKSAMEQKIQSRDDLDRAKFLLAKQENISEGEAYARMRKMSMDKRCSLEEIARRVIQGEELRRQTLDRAKESLMKQYGISDARAYDRIKAQSKAWNCTVWEAAGRILRLAEE